MSSQRKHIKFADAFYLNMGKTPARANDAYWSNGLYDWVSISDLPDGKYIQGTKEKISQKAVDETRIHLVKKGTVIMSFKLTIGKTAIAPFDLYTNEAIMAFEPKDGIEASAEFLYYYLRNYKWSGNRAVMGATINKEVISNSYADLPSLSEQQSIVRELDAISDIIAAKNAQLRELDALAQALFYDTFGDPITNPKGWPVKKLGEISTLLNGRAYSKNELLNKGKYRILRVGNFFTNDSWYYSDLELDADKYCDKGDLLFAWSASFCARIWEGEKVIYHYHIWKVLCDETQLDKVFYCHLLNNMLESMKKDTHGTGMVHLTKIGMEQYYLPLPPLDLQQAFAAKIQAIEAQKQTLRQSIAEFESLLAQRMDYHFN